MYYQYLPLALCTFLWVDCRRIRTLTSDRIPSRWSALLATPVRLIAIVGAKLFGIMAIGFFLFGLADLGAIPTIVTTLIGFGIAEILNYPLTLMVSKK